jgi:hypothetical protein
MTGLKPYLKEIRKISEFWIILIPIITTSKIYPLKCPNIKIINITLFM